MPAKAGHEFDRPNGRKLRRASDLTTAWRRDRHAVGGVFVKLVAQGADRDAEDVGGMRPVAQAVLECLQDQVALDVGDGAADKGAGALLGGERGVRSKPGAARLIEPRAV